jgi:hypothetical protein
MEWFHADHALTEAHKALAENVAAEKEGFFLVTLELPEDLPDLPCVLWGPAMGDPAIAESEVVRVKRSDDRPPSRMVARPSRPSRLMTVIGIGGETIFTAHGGPAAPREVGDPSMNEEEAKEAEEFWAQHALSL